MTLPEIPQELHDLNVRWGDVTVEQAWAACYAAALRHAAETCKDRADNPERTPDTYWSAGVWREFEEWLNLWADEATADR